MTWGFGCNVLVDVSLSGGSRGRVSRITKQLNALLNFYNLARDKHFLQAREYALEGEVARQLARLRLKTGETVEEDEMENDSEVVRAIGKWRSRDGAPVEARVYRAALVACEHEADWQLAATLINALQEYDLPLETGHFERNAHKVGCRLAPSRRVQGAGCTAHGAGCRVQGAW